MMMVFVLVVALAACSHFAVEARKRGESPGRWSLIGFAVFIGPQMLFSWLLYPLILLAARPVFGQAPGVLYIVLSIIGLGVGIYALGQARKRLYRKGASEECENREPVLDIREAEGGLCAVGERLFKTRKAAEEYVTFMRSTAEYR